MWFNIFGLFNEHQNCINRLGFFSLIAINSTENAQTGAYKKN